MLTKFAKVSNDRPKIKVEGVVGMRHGPKSLEQSVLERKALLIEQPFEEGG